MRMTGNALCRLWSQVPGLSEPWCMQIQWRIGQDEELIAALTEPRYPCADDSIETIVLTQTIYLCQLLLHLQEFDPCTGVIADDEEIDEELSRVFQDCIAREYNVAYDTRVRDGPAPDGEALERVVKGLTRAQLEGTRELETRVETEATTAVVPAPGGGGGGEEAQTRVRLHQVLVATLVELKRTLRRTPARYELVYGPRTEATWAARFSTRIMQWRHLVRNGSGALVQGVVEVQPHDVLPLDEEGMQVYQILRSVAPGRIHVLSPVQPEMPATRPWSQDQEFGPQQQHHQPQGHDLRYSQQLQPQHPQQQLRQHQIHHTHHHHQHTRSISSGIKMVPPAYSTPVAHTPVSTPSESADTPRTTPQYPYPSLSAGSHTMEGSSKRASQEMSYPPPTKRLQLMVPPAVPGAGGDVPASNLPIRCGGPMDIDRPQQDEEASSLDTNVLLSRVLSRVTELGQKIDGMQHGMDAKMNQLDERLQRIQESLV
ncbi:hypothetical protein M406DRAFT_70101 [Cryphonectria parasitica EP155]|uniref:Uncharacterized protein n=1 Tax=Cryphonectria parasitica (strain ATCC 38755 / EP155) TaxID=660469 RepID=A0A9P4Y8G7_CRYP1|nr:uncharacterized protein M406DRAFT_70101 [Cryphonectria parasitica EP155]KAF3768000.1 hypothetical protein M406DRAFT_70101 [Cryphonectria parasitica EP155]